MLATHTSPVQLYVKSCKSFIYCTLKELQQHNYNISVYKHKLTLLQSYWVSWSHSEQFLFFQAPADSFLLSVLTKHTRRPPYFMSFTFLKNEKLRMLINHQRFPCTVNLKKMLIQKLQQGWWKPECHSSLSAQSPTNVSHESKHYQVSISVSEDTNSSFSFQLYYSVQLRSLSFTWYNLKKTKQI